MAVLAVLLAVPGLLAQSTRGIIEMHVSDANGGPLPGVTVTLFSDALQGAPSRVTDAHGETQFPHLIPGLYRAELVLEDFQPMEQGGIDVNIGATTLVRVVMSHSISEKLVVTSEMPMIDPTTSGLGINATEDTIKDLPLERNYAAVAAIAPGAQEDDSGQTFYGSTGAENSYYIDGVNTTGIERGEQGKVLTYQFISEVQVKSGGYNAEYGRSTGGVVNVITKSGGNQFHGDIFGYRENTTKLKGEATKGAVVGTRKWTDYRNSDAGADIGGYLVRDKLWFFTAYNLVTDHTTFKSLADFATVLPGAPTQGEELDWNGERDLWAGKLTWQAAQRHAFAFSAFGDPSRASGATFSLAAPPTHYLAAIDTGGSDYSASYDGILGNDVLVTVRRSEHNEEHKVNGPGRELIGYLDFTDPLGNDTVVWGWHGVPPSGYGTFSDEDFSREQSNIDLSYYAGRRHQLKFGWEAEDVSVRDALYRSAGQIIGRYNCNPFRCPGGQDYYYDHFFSVTGEVDPLKATVADIVNPYVVNSGGEAWAAYAQDVVELGNRVTLNVGLRYEEQQLLNSFGEVSADIDNQWSPRVGFTWGPSKVARTKVFGHYGRFYETIPMDLVIRAFSARGTVLSFNYSPDPINVAGLPPDQLRRRSLHLEGSISRVDPDTEGQHIEEYLVGVERSVGANTVVSLSYIHRNLRTVIEDALSADGDLFIGNPGRGLMDVTYDIGYAFGLNYTLHAVDPPVRTFEAVEATARHRLSNNFQFLTSLVWGELVGNYDGMFQASTGQLDPNYNSAFDYYDFSVNNTGFLSNDRTWQFKLNGSYNFDMGLVIGLGAWYMTGTPVTAMGFSDAYGNWEYYLSERGAYGRVDAAYEVDLHLGYPVRLNDRWAANLSLDIFNLLDAQTETRRDTRYTTFHELLGYQPLDWFTGETTTFEPGNAPPPTSEGFNTANRWTPPRSYRLGVSFEF